MHQRIGCLVYLYTCGFPRCVREATSRRFCIFSHESSPCPSQKHLHPSLLSRIVLGSTPLLRIVLGIEDGKSNEQRIVSLSPPFFFPLLFSLSSVYQNFGPVCLSFDSDYLFKLLLIGDSSVGKSCFLLRFAVSLDAPPFAAD